MPRIIFVSTLTLWSMGKGHGGPAFYRTITEYINRGWEVYLITDEESNKDIPFIKKDHLVYINSSKAKTWMRIRKVGLMFRYIHGREMFQKYVSAVEKILQKPFEGKTVLYAYEVGGVAACKHLSRKYGIPFITRFQGTILSKHKGTVVDWIRRYPHYQALSTKSDLVIMTDDGTQGDQVLDSLGNDSNRLFVRNGLDLVDSMNDVCTNTELGDFRRTIGGGVKPDECLFLTVSRLVGWKRVERAIGGFAQFCQLGRSGKLVIVGDGDARPMLEELVRSKGLSDKVYFVGSVKHDDVYMYMRACDVFVSLYDLSNVGNPLLEAMTLGKCIVTLNVGDTNKLITNRKNGILLEKQDIPLLGEIFKELDLAPQFREQLGKEAKKYAKEHFVNWRDRMECEVVEVQKLLDCLPQKDAKIPIEDEK